MAVLPTPGSPMRAGLFFVRRRQDLDDPLDLLLAADDRIELARPGGIGEVDPELVDRGRLRRALRLLGRARSRALGEHADDLVADLVEVHAEQFEHAGRDALALAHQPEKEVLGPDVVVAEAAGFVDRELDDPLGAGREPHLPDDRPIAAADDELDRRSHLRELDVHVLEHTRGDALALAHEAEKQVLGPDVVVVEPLGLILGQRQDLPSAICELVEAVHRVEHPFLCVAPWGDAAAMLARPPCSATLRTYLHQQPMVPVAAARRRSPTP